MQGEQAINRADDREDAEPQGFDNLQTEEEVREFEAFLDQGQGKPCEDPLCTICEVDEEPPGSFDLSDDAEALASAGMGTDEDYGYFGGNEDF